MFLIDRGLNVWTGLDKHGYHTLCLEVAQGFHIENNDHPLKTYRFF